MGISETESWDSIGGELSNSLQRLVPHVNSKHPRLGIPVVDLGHEVNDMVYMQAERGMTRVESPQDRPALIFFWKGRQHFKVCKFDLRSL
jgi:hypothetical protein